MRRFDATENPVGAHVTYHGLTRLYIGEVYGESVSPVTDAAALRVRFFNGEDWGFEPYRRDVNVLERDGDAIDHDPIARHFYSPDAERI